MNCQDFEASINDLARDQIMDSARRADALAHSEGCRGCAARLADERMLSAGLNRLAASNDEAPARVEAALLAHFRERKEIQTGQTATTVRHLSWRRWAIAAAAAVLILIALVALRANQPTPEPVQKAADPQPGDSQPAPTEVRPPAEQKNSAKPVDRKKSQQTHYAADRSRRAAPHTKDSKGKDAPENGYEIATDFIPLTHRGSFAQWEGGQVVRVELPRSALASFGLPVNLERASERVKADVVVGNDGMARAIRFVR